MTLTIRFAYLGLVILSSCKYLEKKPLTKHKQAACSRVGIESRVIHLDESIGNETASEAITGTLQLSIIISKRRKHAHFAVPTHPQVRSSLNCQV